MRKLLFFLPFLLGAQEPIAEDRGAAGMRRAQLSAKTSIRAMHIAAHPDDEDGATITMLARKYGVNMSMLILNRGESGANLVTNDFFDALGALRTVEVLKSAEYYGARVFFTRFIDYGYSKNVGETFRQWKREEVLADMVRIIRAERPHILISRWSGTPQDGHGNHEASGILAQEAFAAAADGHRFPEAGPAWQPLKLYVGTRNPFDGYTIKTETGEYDPVLGRSYAQIAREGLRFQRSQATGGAVGRPGPQSTYYRLTQSKVGMAEKEQSFLERIPDGPNAAPWPEPGLTVEARVDPRSPATGPFAAFRPAETFAVAVPGQMFQATVKLHGAVARKIELLAGPGYQITEYEPGRFRVKVPEDAPYTKAYWSRASIREPKYELAGDFGSPLPAPPVRVRVHHDKGVIETTLKTSSVDATQIEHLHELAVGPPIALQFPTEAGILPLTKRTHAVQVLVGTNVDGPAAGTVRLALPAGWRAEPAEAPFSFAREGEQMKVNFTLTPPAGLGAGEVEVRAVARYQGREYAASFQRVTYPGLRTVYLSKPAVHRVRAMDVRVRSGLRVGYIMGSGDDVPEALGQLGVPYDLIPPGADFSKYTTILLGIRAYAVRPELPANNARLLEFARNGGTVIVQYNTPEFDKNYGPYPYTMGRNPEEVSEEDSPVRMLEPGARVLREPNGITAADFDGWVEQRGSKFFASWDAQYRPLLETQDTGQKPQRGIWLEADYGKGKWIYCALAWYRQLPYAVPGATRIFANLISQ
ncbi:MAG: PIG-L family deacetylase [Acidobacteriota bacterium]